MIRVSVRERPRCFDVYVGNMKVGELRAWDKDCVDAFEGADIDRDHICTEKSIRKAMQAVLVRCGYGKSGPGFKVKERAI